MKKRYRKVGLHEEVFNALKKRTRSLGLTYSDFLRKVLVEDERRKTKELREFFSHLAGIDEKLDYIIMQSGGFKQSDVPSLSGNSSDLRLILEFIKVFGEKFILLPQRRKEFLSFIQQQEQGEVNVLMLFDVFRELVRYLIVNENERRSLEEKIEQLKKRAGG